MRYSLRFKMAKSFLLILMTMLPPLMSTRSRLRRQTSEFTCHLDQIGVLLVCAYQTRKMSRRPAHSLQANLMAPKALTMMVEMMLRLTLMKMALKLMLMEMAPKSRKTSVTTEATETLLPSQSSLNDFLLPWLSPTLVPFCFVAQTALSEYLCRLYRFQILLDVVP